MSSAHANGGFGEDCGNDVPSFLVMLTAVHSKVIILACGKQTCPNSFQESPY